VLRETFDRFTVVQEVAGMTITVDNASKTGDVMLTGEVAASFSFGEWDELRTTIERLIAEAKPRVVAFDAWYREAIDAYGKSDNLERGRFDWFWLFQQGRSPHEAAAIIRGDRLIPVED